MILPYAGWKAKPSTSPVFFFASLNYFNVSLRAAGPEESRFALSEHLSAIYQGITQGTREQLKIISMRIEKTGLHRPVLVYETQFLSAPGHSTRSYHVWSALRREDRRYVDYHLSWTGPSDDPEIQATPEHLSLERRMINFADGFVTVDDSGHSPEQE